MNDYTVIARYRQPPAPNGHQTIIELRQYGNDVARCVDGELQEYTSGFKDTPGCQRRAVQLVQGWTDFERKIGSEMQQWVRQE